MLRSLLACTFPTSLLLLSAACDVNRTRNTNTASTGSAEGNAAGSGGTTASGGGNTSHGAAGSGLRAPRDLPFLREYAERSAPPFRDEGDAPPAAPGAEVAVSVDASVVLRELPNTLYGNNAAVWNGDNLLSATTKERLKTAGVSLLRFPGGSTSDQYHFDNAYPAYATAQTWSNWSQDWAVSTAEYMGVVREIGAIPLLTVNHGYATYDTTKTDGRVENAARLAADWVEYCNAPNDGSNPNAGKDWAAQRATDGSAEPFAVHYWEVGNEVFGDWEVGYDPQGNAYAEHFNVIYDAMKAVDPTIAVGLVVDPTAMHSNWTKTVLANPGTAARADFLIVHTYFGYITSASQVSAVKLLEQATQVATLKRTLDELVTANTSRTPEDLPYYMGEYNVTIPTNSMQISLVSGLFVAKVMGQLASTGWAGASLWDVLNSYDTTGQFGPGDHGFLALGQPDVPDFTPRPTYFDFYFFTRNFGDHLVQVASSDPRLTVYASTFTGGGLGVVAVNEATQSLTVSLTARGIATGAKANAWILTGESVDATAVLLNGVGSGAAAGGPPPESVKPYVLVAGADGSLQLDVPASSVTSIVWR